MRALLDRSKRTRTLIFIQAALAATLAVACADETGDPGSALREIAIEEGALPMSVEPTSGEKAGCNYVDYCNAPGSVGTRCVQSGCGTCGAVKECVESDVPYVCGGYTTPFVIRIGGVDKSALQLYRECQNRPFEK